MTSTQTSTAVRPETGTYVIDPGHSGVTFTGRHLMISKVRGRFGVSGGTLTIADDPNQSSVEATINVQSLESGDVKRDEHLRSADFFDAEQFPTITFTSTKVEDRGRRKLHARRRPHGARRHQVGDARRRVPRRVAVPVEHHASSASRPRPS